MLAQTFLTRLRCAVTKETKLVQTWSPLPGDDSLVNKGQSDGGVITAGFIQGIWRTWGGPREQESSIHHVLVPTLGPGWDAGWGDRGEGNTQSLPSWSLQSD